MSYHVRDLPRCQGSGCHAVATKEVVNSRNARMGVYCAKCAATKLRLLVQW